MKNLGSMMKQVQQMQARMQEMQERLEDLMITGEAGNGVVRVTLNGKGVLHGVHIEPSLLKPEEAEMLEDLLLAAHKDAKSRMDAEVARQMKEITGGLPLPPGMQLPF